jgi:integrase
MLDAIIPGRYTHQLMSASREPKAKAKVWTTTKVENLLHHKGGIYYARFRVSGKRILKSLETQVFSVAKLRLRDEAAKVERARGTRLAVAGGDVTMRDLIGTYKERFESLEISSASKLDRHISLKRLVRTWPDFENIPPKRIAAQDVWAWANRLKNEGSGFQPLRSKRPAKTSASGSTVNRSITALQQLLDIAVEIGAVGTNVARQKPPAGYGRLRKKSDSKPVHLPPHDRMQALFDELERPDADADPRVIEAQRAHRLDVSELVRFMAYSGARQAEAGKAIIGDDRGTYLILHGTKTKTSRDRSLPMNAALRGLLDRIIERRNEEARWMKKPLPGPGEPLLKVREGQKSLDRACRALKLPRLTHHDFRHLFATRCLECGVDPKTVADWLGHADGGVLVLKTYGHVRPEHAAAAAAKVSF